LASVVYLLLDRDRVRRRLVRQYGAIPDWFFGWRPTHEQSELIATIVLIVLACFFTLIGALATVTTFGVI
jgi:hypothetical protein